MSGDHLIVQCFYRVKPSFHHRSAVALDRYELVEDATFIVGKNNNNSVLNEGHSLFRQQGQNEPFFWINVLTAIVSVNQFLGQSVNLKTDRNG